MRFGDFQQDFSVRVTDFQQSWRFLILFLRNCFKIELSGVVRVRRQTQADAPLSDNRRLISFQPAKQMQPDAPPPRQSAVDFV